MCLGSGARGWTGFTDRIFGLGQVYFDTYLLTDTKTRFNTISMTQINLVELGNVYVRQVYRISLCLSR